MITPFEMSNKLRVTKAKYNETPPVLWAEYTSPTAEVIRFPLVGELVQGTDDNGAPIIIIR